MENTRAATGREGKVSHVGMRIEQNPFAEPPWLQVVGSLDHRPPVVPQIEPWGAGGFVQ